MALTQIRIGSLENFHQYDDAVWDTGAEFTQPIIAGAATADTHLLRRIDFWGGTNYINGNLIINTGDALGLSDVGLVVGDVGGGTGVVVNAKGVGSWIGGLSLHGAAFQDNVAWQQETAYGWEPIDPAFEMDWGDLVFGAFNYKLTATGAKLGGMHWDQSVPAFWIRGQVSGSGTMALDASGIIAGNLAGGTGWIINELGQGGFVGGNPVHAFALGSFSWQGLSLTAGDAVIGLYGGGQGAWWDQSAGAWYMRGTLDVVALTVGAGKSITVDTSGSYGQIYFTGVGSIFAAVGTGNLLIDPDGDNVQNLYLGTGATSRFASIIQYGLTFQWFRSGTVAMQLDNSGLAVGGVAVSLSTHNHSGVYSLTSHNHDTVYAAISHTHSGHNLTPTTVTCTSRIRSDMVDNAAGYFPNGGVTANSFWVGAGGYHDEDDDLSAILQTGAVEDRDGNPIQDLRTFPSAIVSEDFRSYDISGGLGYAYGAIKQLARRLDLLESSIKI